MLKLWSLRKLASVFSLLPLLAVEPVFCGSPGSDAPPEPPDMIKSVLPAGGSIITTAPGPRGVDWRGLFGDSLRFLAIEHAFRIATEPGTRDGMRGSYFRGYAKSVGNLHGWSDGDPFIVNFVGHPMQGSVAGNIWSQNDRRYRRAEFGRNRLYWKGKLRAAAFAWGYSTAFEIGPLSEASLGHIQLYYPQQGFVDHVVTPTVGFGWMVAEDAIDKYIIKAIEGRTSNVWLRLLARGGLNPSRTFANVMGGRAPWHRDTRPGIRTYDPEAFVAARELGGARQDSGREAPVDGPAPFEFAVAPAARDFIGAGSRGSCVGGGGSGAFRLAPQWQMVLDVSGCKLVGLPENVSGDSLSFTAGPRWSRSTGRWSPYVHMLAGGNKLTMERTNATEKSALQLQAAGKPMPPAWRDLYAQRQETTGLALEAGTGVSFKVNEAVALQVASLDYTHSWVASLYGINYANGLQFKTGVVLRVGTW